MFLQLSVPYIEFLDMQTSAASCDHNDIHSCSGSSDGSREESEEEKPRMAEWKADFRQDLTSTVKQYSEEVLVLMENLSRSIILEFPLSL
jgi:hypothetical protein